VWNQAVEAHLFVAHRKERITLIIWPNFQQIEVDLPE